MFIWHLNYLLTLSLTSESNRETVDEKCIVVHLLHFFFFLEGKLGGSTPEVKFYLTSLFTGIPVCTRPCIQKSAFDILDDQRAFVPFPERISEIASNTTNEKLRAELYHYTST